MKMKRILSIIILMLALPTASFAARMYYDPNSGEYYTVSYDAYGNRVITDFDTQVSYDEGLPYDDTYYNSYPYYSSPYYYNYNPYPILFFGGGFSGGFHGGHGGFHGGHGGFHGGHHH